VPPLYTTGGENEVTYQEHIDAKLAEAEKILGAWYADAEQDDEAIAYYREFVKERGDTLGS
jgi:hypothetical protein